ncbi:MAG: fumarylacetoacetate hydrolase family protein [Sphingomonadales bacterium]|nr:fumarylacetoacetate hydrolase family protein [Sphingomonadales bacterium]
MRYVSYVDAAGRAGYGRLEGDAVVELGGAGAPADLKAALAEDTLASLPAGRTVPLATVTLLPPIPNPGKILCVAMNYGAHVAEMGREVLAHPGIFTRWNDTLVAHGGALVKPSASDCLDYEGELAVVIGKGGRRIAAADAFGHIAGFSVFNDASVRDWQRHNSQFIPGKNFPATGGFGPALVTPDEIADLPSLRVQTRLNGVLVQDQPIADMLCPVAEIIAYLSAFTELSPGDVIATGTPSGVGEKRKPPLYMQPGDRVEVSIGAVGTLVNPVIAEA